MDRTLPYCLAIATLTFLSTDIEGSTTLLRSLGDDDYSTLLADHHRLIRQSLAAHGGKEEGTQGDSFFATFTSPRACVLAALEMQRSLARHPWSHDAHPKVRMGVHTGEAEEAVTGLVGYQVHRAARIAAVGHGGQVLVSASTAELVFDSLPEDVSLRSLGQHRLKDLTRPEILYQLVAPDLPADFPRLRSLDHPGTPNNLPVLASSFVGREVEIREVQELVMTSRVVTLTGAGGVGKTRLSLQVAAELLGGADGGVWLVEFAELDDGSAVPGAVARALGITGDPGRSMTDTLLDVLADQRQLVVLDNCEHLVDACAKLTDSLVRSCPGVHVLATSREPLGIDGERVYRVPSMSLPEPGDRDPSELVESDAIRLFAARAPSDVTRLGLDDQSTLLVADICRRLDGVPLAIELAAARLKSMSLGALRDHLDQRFRLLEGGSRTALPRHRSLWATIDWSYELLNGVEQAVLRRMSVFAGGFELEAAEAVGGFGEAEGYDVALVVFSLVDKSLVQAELTGETDRYRLLETVRDYAAERLAQADPLDGDSARSRYATWFFDLARASRAEWADAARWRVRLDPEVENLRGAFAYLLEHPDDDCRALRMAINVSTFWLTRGAFDESIAQLREALDRVEQTAPAELHVKALFDLGTMLGANGQLLASRTCLDEGLAIARSLEDPRHSIEILNNLSFVRFKGGENAEAFALAQEAVRLALDTDDEGLIVWSLSTRAVASGDVDSVGARVDLERALRHYVKLGDHVAAVETLSHLGGNELGAGDFDAARDYYERARAAVSELHDEFALGWILQNLSMIAVVTGDLPTAIKYASEGLSLIQRAGSREVACCLLLNVALCASLDADNVSAARLHGAAAAYLVPMELVFEPLEGRLRDEDVARLRVAMGDAAFEAAYAEGAALAFDDAIAIARTIAQSHTAE